VVTTDVNLEIVAAGDSVLLHGAVLQEDSGNLLVKLANGSTVVVPAALVSQQVEKLTGDSVASQIDDELAAHAASILTHADMPASYSGQAGKVLRV
jgi:hypothetical protein